MAFDFTNGNDDVALGVTWQAFEYYKPALEGGLSSRCESRSAHEVLSRPGRGHALQNLIVPFACQQVLWARQVNQRVPERH